MKNRTGSLKKICVPKDQLHDWSFEFSKKLSVLKPYIQKQSITPNELCALYFFAGLFSLPRNQKNLFQGINPLFQDFASAQKQNTTPLSRPLKNLPEEIVETIFPQLEKFHHITLLDLFLYNIRGITYKVNLSFLGMEYAAWKMAIYHHIPTPEKVLLDQIQGKRCLTLIMEEQKISQYILGERDALLFDSMRGIYLFIKDLRALPITQRLLQDDAEFKEYFHYAESDMNAYGPHVFKFLVGAYKKHCVHFTPKDILEIQNSNPQLGVYFIKNFNSILSPDEEVYIQNTLLTLSKNSLKEISHASQT
jgi:hypothetical protein